MKLFSFRPPAWLLALFIFAVALIPRSFALNNTVTPDEPNWVYRTLHFGAALSHGDWAATVQAGHPGVTTMWLGSLGNAIGRAANPAQTSAALDWLSKLDRLSPENGEAYRRLGAFLDWARLPVIFVNTLGVAAIFFLAKRLLGTPVALLAALLLALDPFSAGLAGLLHVDGLLATFTTLSLLALLNGVSHIADSRLLMANGKPSTSRYRPFAIGWFALSGIFAGLATLSKSPALFLLPFTFLVLLLAALLKRLSVRRAFLGAAVCFILHSVFFILLYPAMWSDPSSALGLMLERAGHHAASATRPTFFEGQAELNHGLGFYPLTLAYRLSPIVLAGLIPAARFAFRRRHARTFILFFLFIFSLTFVAALSPAAKKFDRYLLPAIPPLVLIAAWGINQLTNDPANGLVRSVPVVTVLLQAVLVLSVAPYPLMFYSPLLGGAAGARDTIAVGWGEGFGAAARWVEQNDRGATIATGGLSNLAPLYDGRAVTIDAAGLASADYVVFTVSEAQLFPAFFSELAAQGRLAHTLPIGGVDAVWVYANAQAPAQADWLRREIQPGDAILLDAPTPLARAPYSLAILPRDATPEQIAEILNALADSSRVVYVSTPAASPVVRREVRDWLDSRADLESETAVGDAAIRIYTAATETTSLLDPFVVQFDGTLALIGIAPLTDSVAYPDRVSVAARWRVFARPTTNYSATLNVIDANGDSWTTFGGSLRNASDFAPMNWQPGEVVDQVFAVQPPPELVPGAYRLRFSMDRSDGTRAALVSASGVFSGTAPALAALRVEPARTPGNPRSVDGYQRIEHTWPGQVELIGADLLTDTPHTGDRFIVTLHWRSLRDALDPSTELRWRIEPDTGAHAFEWTTSLAPGAGIPFRRDDLIGARYSERLPLDLPTGRYHLSLSIAGEWVDVAGFDVIPRERSFDLPGGATAVGSIGPFDFFLVDLLPAQMRAGEPLEVKVILRAGDETSIDYTVFAHLLDSTGRVIAQVDTWPQGGAWPTSNWVDGQVVDDTYTLTPATDTPSGDLFLALGMYDALDGSRLPARDAAGRVMPEGRLLIETPIRIVAP